MWGLMIYVRQVEKPDTVKLKRISVAHYNSMPSGVLIPIMLRDVEAVFLSWQRGAGAVRRNGLENSMAWSILMCTVSRATLDVEIARLNRLDRHVRTSLFRPSQRLDVSCHH